MTILTNGMTATLSTDTRKNDKKHHGAMITISAHEKTLMHKTCPTTGHKYEI